VLLEFHRNPNTTEHHPPASSKMAQTRKTNLLKLHLPGVDPATIPVLSPEQVDQIPAELLGFLHKHGRVDDSGDLKIITVKDNRHNFTILSIAKWAADGNLEHGELKVEQLELMGLEAVHRPVAYDRSTHEQDITFVATPETHARFLQRLGLYMFSIRAGMSDLQAYTRKTICTQYPVYEAELIALLTTMCDYTDESDRLDPILASFVSARILCLREILVKHKGILPLLCQTISAKDRFFALAGRADHDVLTYALAELREGVGEAAETDALLDAFVEQNSIDAAVPHHIQSAQATTSTTKAERKRKRKRPTKAEAAAKVAKAISTATAGATVREESSTMPGALARGILAAPSATPHSHDTRGGDEADHSGSKSSHGHPHANDNTGGPLSTNEPARNNLPGTSARRLIQDVPASHMRARRPHPGKTLWTKLVSGQDAPSLRLRRPKAENEFWSVTRDERRLLSDHYKRAFTHAGLICETEAGVVAPEPCLACLAVGHVCEVFTGDARNTQFGEYCTRCRLKQNEICSHASRGLAITDIADK
jgi:hypothetical protein